MENDDIDLNGLTVIVEQDGTEESYIIMDGEIYTLEEYEEMTTEDESYVIGGVKLTVLEYLRTMGCFEDEGRDN